MVKNKIYGLILFLFFLLFTTSVFDHQEAAAFSLFSSRGSDQPQQDTKKPQTDYMSRIVRRNTDPLGLKENPALEKILKQPSIKWAIRSAKRHILN